MLILDFGHKNPDTDTICSAIAYTELKNKEKYSTFLDLYDSFGVYVADDELSKSYAKAYGVDTLYQYQHGGLPNIACEWPTSSYLNFTLLTATAYSIFAPSNTAINHFFDNLNF